MLSTTAFYRFHMETEDFEQSSSEDSDQEEDESKVMVIVSRSKNTMSLVNLTKF